MKKERVISFKADEELAESLDKLPNRSDFIRGAIETALANKCPLCHGRGSLSAAQQKHMEHFLHQHPLKKCGQCNTVHFTCDTHSPMSRTTKS